MKYVEHMKGDFMTELERCALMGDKLAQKECADKLIALRCPICNLSVEAWENTYLHHGAVECTICGLRIDADTLYDAIKIWNKRPVPPTGYCKDCEYWSGDQSNKEAACKLSKGIMDQFNHCRDYKPRRTKDGIM